MCPLQISQPRIGSSNRFLLSPAIPDTILGCANSIANRSSGTNRVGPVSLAQGSGHDFVFSLLGYGNTHFGEPVAARFLPDALLISLVC
jgi:hypothetical protein